ncbi:MAG: type II toxin-antitoxin system HicB family antitoxin [SAR324 cluster bacterium]|nr:type II toxin-antitoxin system HicB family antitoxin [SAR324 cluster bacterium]
MDLEYTMIIEPAEDDRGTSYSAFFPDLPGCTTWGATLDELRENAQVAVSEHIAALRDLGKPIPPPRMRAGTVSVKAS